MADELYLLKVHGNHAGEHSEVGMYFHGSNLVAGEVVDNALDLLASFLSIGLPEFRDMCPTTYHVERISARRISPSGGVEMVTQFQDGAQPGTRSGGAASNQLCPVVRLIPPMGTKSAGRFFLPAIAEGDIDGNIVTAGWTTNLTTLMTNLLTNIGSGSIIWLLAVYSTLHDSYVDAVNYDTSPTVGFQRRRNQPH